MMNRYYIPVSVFVKTILRVFHGNKIQKPEIAPWHAIKYLAYITVLDIGQRERGTMIHEQLKENHFITK